MPRAIALVMLLVVAACPRNDGRKTTEPADEPRDTSEDDRRAIQAAALGYIDALNTQDAAAARLWVTATTFAYFEQLHALALSGKRSELEELSIMEIVMVLDVRARFTRAQLEQNDGRAIFDDMIATGISASSIPVDDVRIDEAAGRAEVWAGDEAALWLAREQDRWLVDVRTLAIMLSPTIETRNADEIAANGKLRVAYLLLEAARDELGLEGLDIAVLDGPLEVVP